MANNRICDPLNDQLNISGLNLSTSNDDQLPTINDAPKSKNSSNEKKKDLFNLSIQSGEESLFTMDNLQEMVRAELDDELQYQEAEDIWKQCNEMDCDDTTSGDIASLLGEDKEMREIQMLPKGIQLFSRDKCLSSYRLCDLNWPFDSNLRATRNLANLSPKQINKFLHTEKLNICTTSISFYKKLFPYLLKRLCCDAVTHIQKSLNFIIDNSYTDLFPLFVNTLPICLQNLGAELNCHFTLKDFPHLQMSPSKPVEELIIPESFPFCNLRVMLQLFSKLLVKYRHIGADKKCDVPKKYFDVLEELVVLMLAIGLDQSFMDQSSLDILLICIGNILDLYPEKYFLDGIQCLVEKIVIWLSSDVENEFDHHNVSFVCSLLLPPTPRGAILSASLSFYFLQCFLRPQQIDIWDIVMVEDVRNLISSSIIQLNLEDNCYILLSYLKLIDCAIRPVPLDAKSKIDLENLCDLVQMLVKSKIDPNSEIDQKRMWGLFKELSSKWTNMTRFLTLDEKNSIKFTSYVK